MKLLVTGANGFAGSHLLRALREHGHEAWGLVRREFAGFDPGRHRLWDGRGLDAEILAGIEGVVHAAGVAHRPGAAAAAFDEGNRELTAAIARAVAGSESRVLVHLSSIAATGSGGEAPATPYGRSKREAEPVVEALREADKLGVNLRPPLIYGPGAPGNWAKLLRLVRQPMPLPFGSVRNRRSYLGIENLCSAVLAVLETAARGPGGPGADAISGKSGTYELADAELLSLREVVAILRGAAGRKPALFPFPPAALAGALRILDREAMAEGLFGDLVLDASDFCGTFAWRPPVATPEGMAASLFGSPPLLA